MTYMLARLWRCRARETHKLRYLRYGKTVPRTYCGLLTLALMFVVSPVAAQQQKPPVWRIGWLCSLSSGGFPEFVKALRARGYENGRNIRIEQRYATENGAGLAELAAELVRLEVHVIVTCDSRSIPAARKATSTIPIVMVVSGDPVGTGYVASLARPGGNVTGLTNISPELAGKRLEFLKEVLPSAKRVAVLAPSPGLREEWQQMKLASNRLGIELHRLQVSLPSDFPGAFAMAGKKKAEAMIVLPSPVTNPHARTLVELAARAKLPTIYAVRHYVAAGGLMSYGPSIPEMVRRAADYVDQILKGAKPSDLPVQQPKTFELVINNRTAKALGLRIPQSLLMQAESVIE